MSVPQCENEKKVITGRCCFPRFKFVKVSHRSHISPIWPHHKTWLRYCLKLLSYRQPASFSRPAMFLSIYQAFHTASIFLLDVQSSTDKKLAAKQDRQTLWNLRCYCTDKSPDVCIFARFKVNCEVMSLRSFAIF